MQSVRIAAIAAAGLALLGSGAGALAEGPRAPSTVRTSDHLWHGLWIRSLDAPAVTAAACPPLSAEGSCGSAGEPAPSPRRDERLSNERTFTRWANMSRRIAVHARPTSTSKRITTLHALTEDGFPEVYLLLRTHWDSKGREWVRVRVPMRPNGRSGWVRREGLGRFHLTTTAVVVDRKRLRLKLFDSGVLVLDAPAGIGKRGTGTPAGRFWIRERFEIQDRRSGYWPYAFGTSAYSKLSDWPGGGIVGIHGPYFQSALIPGRISHGCVRLRVADDRFLAIYMKLGTPVRIL